MPWNYAHSRFDPLMGIVRESAVAGLSGWSLGTAIYYYYFVLRLLLTTWEAEPKLINVVICPSFRDRKTRALLLRSNHKFKEYFS